MWKCCFTQGEFRPLGESISESSSVRFSSSESFPPIMGPDLSGVEIRPVIFLSVEAPIICAREPLLGVLNAPRGVSDLKFNKEMSDNEGSSSSL